MAGAVGTAEPGPVVGPLRSTLRSRAVVDAASSACCPELPNAAECWSNDPASGGGTAAGPGNGMGRAGMSMCRRLMAGLNRSSLRSIGLSVTLSDMYHNAEHIYPNI